MPRSGYVNEQIRAGGASPRGIYPPGYVYRNSFCVLLLLLQAGLPFKENARLEGERECSRKRDLYLLSHRLVKPTRAGFYS